MRPQQKNRQRGRGNGGNNRRNQNPLTRSYESNGPDVKVRGSAQQVADKYTQLARDATSAGDRVMAENYLQHAEHYNRIIVTAMAQQAEQQREREDRGDRDRSNRFDRQQDGDEPRGQQDERSSEERSLRRRRRREDEPRDEPSVEGVEAGVDASEAPQPEVDTPAEPPRPRRRSRPVETADGEEAAPRRARRPRRTARADDDGPTSGTGDSDAAGEAPLGSEEGLARTVTRTRRRRAPTSEKRETEEMQANDAAE